MKNYSSLFTLAILCLSIYSCRKSDFKDPATRCKILETANRFFTYDSQNRPLALTFKVDPDATGNATYKFTYDSKGRLISHGGFNSHDLTYNLRGQAVIDTFIQNYAGQDTRYAQKIYYDHYGRISKVVSELFRAEREDLPLPHTIEVFYYNYDKRGNLIRPSPDGIGTMKYDNKTNINRINPLFMFINKDYSLNNPDSDTEYNAAGLPFNYYETWFESDGVRDVVYSCNGGNGN